MVVLSEPAKIRGSVTFGEDFELDFRAYKLRRSGRVVKLERIPMEVLLFLIEQSGQLVTREQIVEKIWGKDVFLDTDNSINGAIRKIRQVLKDDPEQPRFIQTITGKGYRFIAPVVDAEVEEPLALLSEPPVTEPRPKRSIHSQWPVAVGIAVVIVAALGGWFLWSRTRSHVQQPGGRLMLAVLPFENLTGDAGEDYLSDGMTEEMIAQLGRMDPQHLGVIARTSVMHYKHSQQQLDQIGRELGVQYVIEGSVRRDTDKMRITAQLIQMRDQTHLWARSYDRELSSLLSVQGEIAQEITDEIQLALGDNKRSIPVQPSLSPKNYEAYDLYLKGRYFWNKRTTQGFQQAIGYFQQAVAKEPNYARAYAGLADCYTLATSYGLAPPKEFMPKARAAAVRALEIDQGLADAHTSLALIAQNYDWDFQAAEKEYRHAIALNPNYATAHHWYAEYLAFQGRFDEALAESERARQLDPLSLIIAADNGAILYFSRQYDRAIQQFRAVLDMEPQLRRAHLVVGAYVEKGMFAEALAEEDKWQSQEDSKLGWSDLPWQWASRVYIYGRAGQRLKAQQALDKLEQLNQRRRMDPMPMLVAYASVGEKDQAFAWSEKAYQARSSGLVSLKVDPVFDPLRTDPRFLDLLRRVGLEK